MKIQCDVCEKEEAIVFCGADEAALCEECDARVHHANKLATKHKRFSLLPSSTKDAPLCDICQNKRAFLFCKEDRAILCTECDIPIHVANEHTSKHNRFLLTGAKLSASATSYPDSIQPNFENNTSFTTSNTCDNAMFFNRHVTVTTTTASTMNYNQISEEGSTSTTGNTMPEYVMDTLPGWRLEDLLASSSTSHDLYY